MTPPYPEYMRATKQHTIRWYGIAEGESFPRNRYMRGGDWGWDVTCSCGWKSRTGGAIEARIREAVAEHKWDVANGFWSESA
jgi:hypothetical protein